MHAVCFIPFITIEVWVWVRVSLHDFKNDSMLSQVFLTTENFTGLDGE